MKTLTTVAVLAMVFMATGCASIISSSSYPVTVENNGPPVAVTIADRDGKAVHSGTTPFTVTLKAAAGYGKPQIYTIKGRGVFEELSASLDPWYFGNCLFGLTGVVGILIIDPATGAMFKLPSRVMLNETPAE